MARDPYDPCPCGSGNKLKFCCASVATEMEKVERLLGNNQPHMAIQSLDKLKSAHSDSQWVRVCLASTLINDDQPADAKLVLKELLKQHPEQPFANALYALASYNADGYPTCKRAANRAFKQSTSAFPDLVGTLASAVAESLLGSGKVMAARQYLVIAMRIANDEHRRILFEDLMELDGDTTIPYPLRGVRQPMEFDDSGDAQKPARMAARLATVGCFGEAADRLDKIAEDRQDDARLRYNVGLFRAWDGDHEPAITAFRQAAQLFVAQEQTTSNNVTTSDVTTADAIECEVLAQLLEQSDTSTGTPMRMRRFDLTSVSQLLSRLDEADRFARIDRSSEPPMQEPGGPAARYVYLSRSIDDDEPYREWTWESVPLIEGRITIFDNDPQGEQPAQAFIVGLEGDELAGALKAFTEAASDLAKPVEQDAETPENADITGHVPAAEMPLRWSGFVPPTAPGEVARQTARQRWDAVIDDVWPNQLKIALGDRSTAEAASGDQSRIATEAALVVFDAYADARSFMLPVEKLRERFSLAAPSPLEIDEQTHINSLSTLQVLRLQQNKLSESQFDQLLKRATLLRHSRLLYDVLREALERPHQTSEPDARDRVLATIAGLCGNSLRHDETLDWIEKGREAAGNREHAFEALLEWKMRELTLRVESPEDPALQELLEDLWHNYGAKLPQLREYLMTIVEMAGVKPPWDSAILAPAAAVASDESWSGGEEPTGEKKLWLPGDGE